uniref:Protein BUD31 homolog n=1 Tax=Meloidogyne hapla TaxID=6305 RepID=A0A1I8C252_MELHA
MSLATKLRRIRKKPPEGWDLIEPTLEEFEAKMREAETEPHEIHHQRSRYIFNLFYKEEKISKELYQFCVSPIIIIKNKISHDKISKKIKNTIE